MDRLTRKLKIATVIALSTMGVVSLPLVADDENTDIENDSMEPALVMIDNLDLSQGFAIALRFQLDGYSPFAPIVSATSNPDLFGDGFSVYVAEGRLGLFIASADSDISPSDTEISDGDWHGLCVVFDSGKTALYLDGALAIQADATLDFASLPDFMSLGTLVGDETIAPFDGAIDDFRLYVHALADADASAASGDVGGKNAAPSGGDEAKDEASGTVASKAAEVLSTQLAPASIAPKPRNISATDALAARDKGRILRKAPRHPLKVFSPME